MAVLRRGEALRRTQARAVVLAPFVSFAATLHGLRSAFRSLDHGAATWVAAVDGTLTSLAATTGLMLALGGVLALHALIAPRHDGT